MNEQRNLERWLQNVAMVLDMADEAEATDNEWELDKAREVFARCEQFVRGQSKADTLQVAHDINWLTEWHCCRRLDVLGADVLEKGLAAVAADRDRYVKLRDEHWPEVAKVKQLARMQSIDDVEACRRLEVKERTFRRHLAEMQQWAKSLDVNLDQLDQLLKRDDE